MDIKVNPKLTEYILNQSWRSKFINNCINKKDPLSPSEILSNLLGNRIDPICSSFTWMNTPEGWNFWSKIDTNMYEKSEKEHWEVYI